MGLLPPFRPDFPVEEKVLTFDIAGMRKVTMICMACSLLASLLWAQEKKGGLDNNAAFYEGETMNYIVTPPDSFKMVSDEAIEDGYSFAFIPTPDTYAKATVTIGVNIFKVRENQQKMFSLNELIRNDTSAVREHFGKSISIAEVDPIVTDDGHVLRTFYLNDSTTFIPNVMLSYYDGGTEVFIFDLSISGLYPRFRAEGYYIACLKRFKAMLKGSLGIKG